MHIMSTNPGMHASMVMPVCGFFFSPFGSCGPETSHHTPTTSVQSHHCRSDLIDATPRRHPSLDGVHVLVGASSCCASLFMSCCMVAKSNIYWKKIMMSFISKMLMEAYIKQKVGH